MPRKSYRRIALDELLVKYHGLQSTIFTKYAIESDSESASDDDQPDLEMRDISGYDRKNCCNEDVKLETRI